MIYQCYECEKLFQEDEGAMVMEKSYVGPVPVISEILAFKCKECISEKGRKIIERIQNERKIKGRKQNEK